MAILAAGLIEKDDRTVAKLLRWPDKIRRDINSPDSYHGRELMIA